MLLSPYMLRRLCSEGKIPCFKFGEQWRFDKGDILMWRKNNGFQ
ncbi:MAG: helix-turn-helix domain-containing protein [Candidatus Omnitrophica bacterium]|nr:helix-turn-helix domain-containing protein [Candidatus Omnitrophota bacterium]